MLQKFSFQAVTREGKAMTGNISANSIDEARAKLSASGLSILSLEAFQGSTETKAGMQLYEFQGETPDHKTARGTIESTDEYAAYKKLCTTYQLKLNYLVSSQETPEAKRLKQQAGIDPALEQKLQEETKATEDESEKKNVDETEQILEEQKKEIAFIQAKTEEVVKEVKNLLEKGGKYIRPEQKRALEEKLDLLARLRRSNSVEHLKNLVIKTIKDLSSDALFIEEELLRTEDREAWIASKSEFQKFGMGFEKNINKGLAEIQSLFANIDPEKLKALTENVKNINPVRKFFSTVYYTFSILLTFCLLFWGWMMLKSLLGTNPAQTSFFFHSGALWYTTMISCLVTGFLFFEKHSPLIDNHQKRLGIAAGAITTILFMTFEFNLIFFWI